jgi:hypothetical protein
MHRPLSTIIGYPSLSIVSIGVRPDILTVTDGKVSIGYPIASVVDVSIRIEPYRHRLWLVTECPRLRKRSLWGLVELLPIIYWFRFVNYSPSALRLLYCMNTKFHFYNFFPLFCFLTLSILIEIENVLRVETNFFKVSRLSITLRSTFFFLGQDF